MITLIIVDCQNDFISGSMSVKKAKNALESIKHYITKNKSDIEKIIFTVDWHPYNHMSFKKYGGIWPSHCVQYTPGACIEPKLLKLVHSLELDFEVVQKGCVEEVEEYGAFSEIDFVDDEFGKRCYLDYAIANPDSNFVVCGIAGDYCVKETIQNMIDGGITPSILIDGIVSIDNGTILRNFIVDNNLNEKFSDN